MIGPVRGAAGSPSAAAPSLRRFAASLRRRQVVGSALGVAARGGLLLALPLVVFAWVAPDVARVVGAGGAALLVAVAAFAGVAAWRRAGRQQARWPAEASTRVFQDELRTWLELDRARRQAPSSGMFGWLEREVHEGLRPHRREAARAATRFRLGRWRWLGVPLAALLVAWLLSGWIEPPWRGGVGGAAPRAGDGDSGGGAAGASAGTLGVGAAPETPAPGPEEPRDDPEAPARDEAPPVDGDDQDEPEASDEPPPLLDLPDDRRFVLPDFIGDGPTRRARMHVAELEQPQPVGARPRPARPQGGGGAPPAPESVPLEFERASEEALRSRHVPPAERAIVRRFFERLQQRGKR